MIKNYFLVALRNITKQKIFAFINIFGLAVGLASTVFIFLYIVDELSFDTIHPEADRTYRIGATVTMDDGNTFQQTYVPGGWASQLKEQYPDVKEALRYLWAGYPAAVSNKEIDKIILTEELFWTEGSFDKVLYFPIVKGNPDEVFTLPNAIVLTESAAESLFGDEDPIGKRLDVSHPGMTDNQEVETIVTAVIEDFPSNSHLQPKYLVNYEVLRPFFDGDISLDEFADNLQQGFFSAYIVLSEDADAEQVQKNLGQLVTSGLGEDAPQVDPFIQKVTKLHFDEVNQWTNEGAGDIQYVYIFGSIGLLILIIACINYMNLATARSSKRAKEVGLRKAMGSNRKQLIAQFMNESFLTTLLGLILGVLLIALFLPTFNDLAYKNFSLTSLLDPAIIIGVFGILLLVAVVAGSYPALFLSGFNPVEVLKGQQETGKSPELFRKVLVTFQFTITVILVISTGVMLHQMNYIQSSKLNEGSEQMVSIRFGGFADVNRYPAYRQALLQNPDIQQVTMGNHLPRQNYFGPLGTTLIFPSVNSEQEYDWSQLNVDFAFPETYDLELITGRFFDPSNPSDSNAYLLNEAALRNLGIELDEVLGMEVLNSHTERSGTVIGVVEDFPYRSMHQTIGPLAINARPHPIDQIVYVKLPTENLQTHLAYLEDQWKEAFPNVGFDYWFLSDEFGRLYQAESRMADLAQTFSVLAILIACLGLFGLASYMAERRTKEIGIRKVLGASVPQIIALLLTNFVKMVLIAIVIAIPLAYLLMNDWLQNFVYHVPMSAVIFIIAIVLVLALTLITVGYEAIRASTANPVKSIRHE
ncbi:MAG: FtsX-like permease family protein [Cyclobacteriaceae bacterium]